MYIIKFSIVINAKKHNYYISTTDLKNFSIPHLTKDKTKALKFSHVNDVKDWKDKYLDYSGAIKTSEINYLYYLKSDFKTIKLVKYVVKFDNSYVAKFTNCDSVDITPFQNEAFICESLIEAKNLKSWAEFTKRTKDISCKIVKLNKSLPKENSKYVIKIDDEYCLDFINDKFSTTQLQSEAYTCVDLEEAVNLKKLIKNARKYDDGSFDIVKIIKLKSKNISVINDTTSVIKEQFTFDELQQLKIDYEESIKLYGKEALKKKFEELFKSIPEIEYIKWYESDEKNWSKAELFIKFYELEDKINSRSYNNSCQVINEYGQERGKQIIYKLEDFISSFNKFSSDEFLLIFGKHKTITINNNLKFDITGYEF
jgi:hypothetical protein